jgi:hypothetical protein
MLRAGKLTSCADAKGCSAEWTWNGAAGRFDVAVEYFDLQGGAAKFSLFSEWAVDFGVEGGW